VVLLVLALFATIPRSAEAISIFCDENKPFARTPVTCTADNSGFDSESTTDVTCCFSVEQKGAIVQAAQCFPVRTDPAPFVATFTFTPVAGKQFVNANCCGTRNLQGACEMGGTGGIPLNTAFIGSASLTITPQAPPAGGARKLVGFGGFKSGRKFRV